MPSKKRSVPAKRKPGAASKRRGAAPAPASRRPKRDSAAPTTLAASRRGHAFPIVGIGASAGGLEALEELFAAMPVDTGMGFVIVTHQHPGHTSLLPELLGNSTRMPVVVGKDGMRVEPDHVYVSPPGGDLAILRGRLHRMERPASQSPHLPIDYFFRSLAEDQEKMAICIILSGTGTDGTLGLKAIKGAAGMAMVQQVQSAKYAGMPGSAVATGMADFVIPIAEMPSRLLAYARGPWPAMEEESAAFPESLQKIFVLLRTRTGADFSGYKPSTIRRRIERRMNLHQIKEPREYARYLQESPHEIDLLFRELLISVTSFFRDPEAFEALKTLALAPMVKSCAEDYQYRIWVPGCATGEEVFSLAIAVRECLEAAKRSCDVQIFGTDLDAEAIEAARSGRFPAGIAGDVSPARLERYFTRDDSGFSIRKDIREMAIFAVQNAIKDPPFTKLDLISCRNLLIYLNADLQRRLLPVFHYALKPGGLLFLGSSETIGGLTDLFEVVDKKWKIFRRREVAPAPYPIVALAARQPAVAAEVRTPPASRPARERGIAAIVERLLLARFAPPSVVVSERGDVVFIHGRTGAWLEPAAGQPRLNLFEMAREGLQAELASALREALASEEEVLRENVRVKTNGGFTHVDLSVSRLREPESARGLMLVSFRPRVDEPAPPSAKGRGRVRFETSKVQELEQELKWTKESLQATIVELATANEELQSTNEEIQSSNEEMETSKEEMQSLNEELTTVNAEMQSKVDELSRTNDDMQNLLNSTEVATVFLDRDLNVKRFTEPARRLIHLIPSDLGRPLEHLASNLPHQRLVEDCREVLRTLAFKVEEVRTREGHWYLMRILPYRTTENVIAGVVVTFVDINPVKAAEKSLLRMSKVFLEGPEPMMVLDLEGKIIDVNEEGVRASGWSRRKLMGEPFDRVLPKSSEAAAAAWLEDCLAGETVRGIECTFLSKSGRETSGSITLKLLTDDRGQPDAICLLAKNASA